MLDPGAHPKTTKHCILHNIRPPITSTYDIHLYIIYTFSDTMTFDLNECVNNIIQYIFSVAIINERRYYRNICEKIP